MMVEESDPAFTLYITGHTARSERAIQRTNDLLHDCYGSAFQLMVIDVLEHPEDAARDNIVATPALLRIRPLPARRLVGDLTDRARAMSWLGLTPSSHERQERDS